jgi:hypothetical protein
VPAERVDILDYQLELLAVATATAMDDERDVKMALGGDHEGIGAAAQQQRPLAPRARRALTSVEAPVAAWLPLGAGACAAHHNQRVVRELRH